LQEPVHAPVTEWRLVALLIGAGLIAACQVGKAAVSVPQLRHDLGLGLAEVSSVIGAYGALGAATGLVAGALVARIGTRTALVGGLAVIAFGSASAAFAGNLAQLFAARVVEGCGLLSVVIAAPALLNRVTAVKDRTTSFALWGCYMPLGTALMMIAGPALMASGWRLLWLANGALVLTYAILLLGALPRSEPSAAAAPPSGLLPSLLRVVTAPGPVLLALAFGTYTFQYFALTTLFPALLVERMGLSIAGAGSLSALVVLANALGNLSAGGLMRLGIPLWATAAAGFAAVALCSLGVFSGLPTVWVCVFAAVSLAVSGAIPASIFAGTPALAPAPALIPITLGFLMQASNLGQLLGPVALGAWIERVGWSSGSLVFGLAGAAGLAVAAALRRRLTRG
jgi:MFS transporter, DHA1 family, inner membrane transport protein